MNPSYCLFAINYSTSILDAIRYFKRPTSVTLPFTTLSPFFSVSTKAELLYSTDSAKILEFLFTVRLGLLSPFDVLPLMYKACTVIRFYVSVPVLSVHISFAPPMVSEACSLLTRLFSLNILLTENARLIVTASGNPSGTATTITVTAIIKALRIPIALFQVINAALPVIIVLIKSLIIRALKVKIAT